MAKYEFTGEQVKVVLELLSRTQLQGKEVNAYNVVTNIFNNPIKENDTEIIEKSN